MGKEERENEINGLRKANSDLRRLHHMEMNWAKRKKLEAEMRKNRDRILRLEFEKD